MRAVLHEQCHHGSDDYLFTMINMVNYLSIGG